jgi:hypothetical protein
MLDAPPESLLEIQIWFAKHITAPIIESDSANIPLFSETEIDEIRKRISPGPLLTSEERLGVYQQQYWWRLINVCQEIFPSLIRLFGYEDFNQIIAEPYLLKYPPQDWFLSNIGNDLPKWLKKYYRKSDAPLVLSVALLDLAYETLLFADLLPPINSQDFGACDKKKLYLQPYVLLFALDADFFAFREELMQHPPEHYETNDFPKIASTGKKKYFVLYRMKEENVYEEISSEFFDLLTRFKKGAKLNDLLPILSHFDGLLETFQLMAKRSWLTFNTKSASIH